MWILKFFKGVGRVILAFLFILVGLTVAAMIFNAVGLFWAIVITVPTWIALAWFYQAIFGPRTAVA